MNNFIIIYLFDKQMSDSILYLDELSCNCWKTLFLCTYNVLIAYINPYYTQKTTDSLLH